MRRSVLVPVLIFILFPLSSIAGVGKIDNREYVNRQKSPYNMIVHFMGKCTGQYVASDLILTNAHCVYQACHDSEISMPLCRFENFAGKSGSGRVVSVGRKYSLNNGGAFVDENYSPDTDWAIIKTDDLPSDTWFNVGTATVPGRYNSVGFGAMRIIADDELPIIRKKYVSFLRKRYDMGRMSAKKILNETKLETTMWADFDSFLSDATDETGVSIAPLFPADEEKKLKLHADCEINTVKNGYFFHNCDTFHGNSGGAIFRQNQLHGIVAGGQDKFSEQDGDSFGVDAASFWPAIKELLN